MLKEIYRQESVELIKLMKFIILSGVIISCLSCGGGSKSSNNPVIPPAPTNLIATAGNAQVALSWSASTTAISYNVYNSTTSGGPYTKAGSASSTNYTITGLTNGTPYYFVVTAINSSGESRYSNQASATSFSVSTLLYGVDMNRFEMYPELSQQGITDTFTQTEQLGVDFVRFGIDWPTVQPTQTTYNNSFLSAVFSEFQTYHLKILVELSGPPSWASTNPTATDPYDYPPANYQDFYNYVKYVANYAQQNYPGIVIAYKVLNEPSNIDCSTNGGFPPTAYAHLVYEAKQAVSSVSPTIPVMTGGMWSVGVSHTPPSGCPNAMSVYDYQNEYLTDSTYPVWQYVDIANLHMGVINSPQTGIWQRAVNQVQGLLQMFLSYKPNIPIWVDEFAYTSLGQDQNVPGYQCGQTGNTQACEQVQANYITDALNTLIAIPQVKAVSWTYMVDNPCATSGSIDLGLLAINSPSAGYDGCENISDADVSVKPAYTVYHAFIMSHK
jgi:hypothetical protein